MGLGNKSNGGRINRLWRGRRRRRWFAAALAPAPPPPPPPTPLGFGPIDSEPYEQPAADGGGFGPIDDEPFDAVPTSSFGPIDGENLDLLPVGAFGPICAEPYDAAATGQLGPVDAYDLLLQPTTAFSEPARTLVPGRGYTRSSPTKPRTLDSTPTLDLTLAHGSFQLASLPSTDGDTMFTQVELQCTAGSGITVDAVVTITDQDGNTVVPSTTLTNFRNAGDVFSLVALGATRLVQQAATGAALILVVTTPASVGTLQAVARVVGFPVA